MIQAKTRFLSLAILSIFSFVLFAPEALGDDRDQGVYDQTYEINNSRLSFDGSSQNSSWSGAYSFSLPITVPSGRNGMQPSLTLSYNSQISELDSFYGTGWSLGIPYIVRINKTGLNNLYDETNFSSSLSGELVNETGTPYGDYAAKVEDGSFLTYEFNADDSWTVTDKSGTVYSFGTDTDSRQDDSADTTRISKWMLEEVRDTNDNYVRYEYFKENGQVYPERISYTGNGSTDGIFSVNFTLETRSDPSTFFNTSFEVQTTYRVSEITASVNGVERRSYAFAYTTPDDTVRSILESVTESAVSESGTSTTLPPTSFNYEESDKGWTEVHDYTIPVYFYVNGGNDYKGVEIADVNGDGLLDIMNSGQYSGPGSDHTYINQGNGTGWVEDAAYSIPVYFWGTGGTYMKNARMADLNGDGFSDILNAFRDGSETKKAYIFDEASATWVEDAAYSIPLNFNHGYMDDQGVRLLDINGDSFPDFVQSLSYGSGTQSIYLFDPETESWNSVGSFSIPVSFNDESNDDEGVKLADVNGDGLVDIVESRRASSTSQAVYINQGDGTGWLEDPAYSIPVYFWNEYGTMVDVVDIVDVNGDGLPDIVYGPDDTHDDDVVYINQGDGTGWVEDAAYTVPVRFASDDITPHGVQIFDVDGDNFPDVVHSELHGSADKGVYLNNATPELLETIMHPSGATTTVAYAPSTEFDNPNMPFVMNLVSSIITDDGLGQTASTFFDYSGGAYYYEDELNRQFAGFEKISRREEERKTISYYIQDDLAKIGRTYMTEVYEDHTDYNDNDGDGLTNHDESTMYGTDPDSADSDADELSDGDELFLYKTNPLDQDTDGDYFKDDYELRAPDGDPTLRNIYPQLVMDIIAYNEFYAYEEFDSSWNTSPVAQPNTLYTSYLPKSFYLGITAYEEGIFGISEYYFNRNGESIFFGDYGIEYCGTYPTQINPLITAVTCEPVLNEVESADPENTVVLVDEEEDVEHFSELSNSDPALPYIFERFKVVRIPEGLVDENHVFQIKLYIGADKAYDHFAYTEVPGDMDLYKRSIDTWSTSDLGSEASFVYKSQSLLMDYDGDSHRDSGTAYTYDANGNVESVINYGEVSGSIDGSFTDIATLNEEFTIDYTYATDSSGEIRNKVSEEKITNSAGVPLKKTRYFYDGLAYGTVSIGNNTRSSDWLNTTGTWLNSQYTYDAYGLVLSAKNPRDCISNFTYDAYNLYPSSVSNPKSYSVSMEYDYASGQVTSQTDENGITYSTTYDGFGRPLTVQVPNPETGVLTTLSTNTYDDVSMPNSVSTSSTVEGVTSESVVYVDGFGRSIQTNTLAEDGNYSTVDIWYDQSGNVIAQSLPYFTASSSFGRDDSSVSTESTYDVLDRPLTITMPTGTTSYDYSIWENTVTDSNGIEKTYAYDSAGNLLSTIENNDSESYESTYTYNPLGQLVKLTDAEGNERNFIYDSLGRKISQEDLHDPSSASFGTWYYTYDNNSNLSTQTDPLGQVITWAYDQLDRVTYEDWDMSTAARDYSYSYDSGTLGRMKLYSVYSNTNDAGLTYNSYDYLGNNTQAMYRYKKPGLPIYDSYGFQRTYDLLSREIQVTYPSSALTVNTTYNELGAIEKITRGTSTLTDVVSDFDYTPAGQATSISYGNGTVTTNIYDIEESYRLTNKTSTGTYGGVGGNIQSLSYSYDSVGNITGVVDDSISPTAKTLTYEYDDLNRLLSADSTGLSIGDYSESYTYDSLGNITSKSDIGSMVYGGTGSPNPHAVTDVNGTVYAYDANGNLLSDGVHSYVWDKRNRLSSSDTQAFYYDFSGQRYKTLDSSSGTDVHTYYISPLMELRDRSLASPGKAVYNIFAGSQRVATLSEGIYSYVAQDHLGGTALITDESGAVTEIYDYYPYGAELIADQLGTTETAHTFTDKEFSEELGLYYFEARWYNPSIGRFASLDPAQLDSRVFKLTADPQSLNFYAYSRNNPVNLVDPSGESFGSFLSGIVNSWASNNLAGAGRYNNPSDSHYTLGQAIGDVASMVTGAMEIVTGASITGGGTAGGLALAPATAGFSIPAVSGTSIVTGAAVATHGATAMLSGGQNFGQNIRSIAEQIGNGHAWGKHIEQKGEFNGMFNTQDDFVDYIDGVMNNATEVKQLQDGRTGYWDDATQGIVIHDPNNADAGTAFQSDSGKSRFDNLK